MEGLTAEEFYAKYFDFIGDSESPNIYHRWVAVSIVGALLGRQFHIPFSHSSIYPNFYVLLLGTPGARKGSAISPGRKLLKATLFKHFAPDRLSPEMFIHSLHEINHKLLEDLEIEVETLNFELPSEMYVNIGEFADFIGTKNMSFVNLLTNLWDNLDEYTHPKFHGRSVYVYAPTISILSASTPQSMSDSLPIECIGQGFLSRFILVHGEATGVKIAFPKPTLEEKTLELAAYLKIIKHTAVGVAEFSAEAKVLADKIYKSFSDLEDFRFKHYGTRRFIHFLKLAMILAAMRLSTSVSKEDVLQANTILHFTEQRMPKALGEFGKGKHGDVANAVMEILRSAKSPMTPTELWKPLSQDLDRLSDLIDILKNLQMSEKIHQVTLRGKKGFLPLNKLRNAWPEELLVPEFLTPQER